MHFTTRPISRRRCFNLNVRAPKKQVVVKDDDESMEDIMDPQILQKADQVKGGGMTVTQVSARRADELSENSRPASNKRKAETASKTPAKRTKRTKLTFDF